MSPITLYNYYAKKIFIMWGFLSKLVSFFDLRKKQEGSDEQGDDYLSVLNIFRLILKKG